MKKQSMTAGGFKITAWKDAAGLMRMEIKSTHGREVLHGLDTLWERSGNWWEHLAFTDNENIIEYLSDLRGQEEDGQTSPGKLRLWAKDPVFNAWFKGHSGGTLGSPLELAKQIEAARRRDGRDPATGAMLRGDGELARPALGGS